MFEEFSNPLKGKGKEKDVGKRRAYCRVITSLGGGGLNIELFCEKVRTWNVYSGTGLLYPPVIHYPGAKNMLQLPNVGESGQVQGCAFPPAGSRVHGECAEETSDQLAFLTPSRSRLETPLAPAQAGSRIGVPRSEMNMI